MGSAGRAFHFNINPVSEALLVEKMIAGSFHDCLFREHGNIEGGRVHSYFLIFKDVNQAYCAFQVFVFLSWP